MDTPLSISSTSLVLMVHAENFGFFSSHRDIEMEMENTFEHSGSTGLFSMMS